MGSTPRGPSPARLTGSTLVRLLAGLADVDAAPSSAGFTERVSRWVGWTDAISLASALNAAPVATSSSGAVPATPRAVEERECLRVRQALAQRIASEGAPPPAKRRPHALAPPPAAAEAPPEFATFRRRHLACQQAMETDIAALRRRLRDALGAASPAMARLAALDALMEPVIGAQERTLLAAVPRWLEKRFERLRLTPAPAAAPAAASGAWLAVFRQDQQAVLLAELDLRMQPVEGLLAALRASHAGAPRAGHPPP